MYYCGWSNVKWNKGLNKQYIGHHNVFKDIIYSHGKQSSKNRKSFICWFGLQIRPGWSQELGIPSLAYRAYGSTPRFWVIICWLPECISRKLKRKPQQSELKLKLGCEWAFRIVAQTALSQCSLDISFNFVLI